MFADLLAFAYEKPWAALWIVGLAAGALNYLFKLEKIEQQQADKQSSSAWLQTSTERTETRPDNPRFATWEEAFNRPVTDPLRFQIEYVDGDGVVTDRDISPVSIHLRRGEADILIKAHCHLRNEQRTFRSERIQSCRNLATGRRIGDLGQYLRGRY